MAQHDSRRSTAAQFFLDDDAMVTDSKSSAEKVVNWLNDAALMPDSAVKTDLLRKVQETIINKEPDLLDNFLHEVLAFQNDRSIDVRKFVVGFIEEACKKDWDLLPKLVSNLQMLVQDSNAQVQKRVVQAATQVYRGALMWLARARVITEEMQAVWAVVCSIKALVINVVDSDNDGVRTQAVKFLECLVLVQTYPEEDSLKRENDFSLDDIPLTLKIARRRKLEEEALTVFELMVKFHGSAHISSVNLMACMGSLTLIAKMRPQFMGKVIAALETLHMNLPPTLSKSQVSSVRKHLKLQLLNLLKHPASVQYHSNITTLLTDLGATYHEVMKVMPKMEETRVRMRGKRSGAENGSTGGGRSKKARREDVPIYIPTALTPATPVTETAIDITEQFVIERLSPELAADLVVLAMNKLPDQMPPLFSATYTPIAAAGTHGQIKHLSRLIAAQLNAIGLGPGAKQAYSMTVTTVDEDDDDEDMGDKAGESAVQTTILPPPTFQPPKLQKRTRKLKLVEITKPLSEVIRDKMAVSAVKRILGAEQSALNGGVLEQYSKMVATLAMTASDTIREAVLEYIKTDLRANFNLVLAWLYGEYSYLQGFNRRPPGLRPSATSTNLDRQYNSLLCQVIQQLVNNHDIKDRDTLLLRIYLEAPLITDEASEMLKELCCSEVLGLTILQELVVRRPPRQLLHLNALLTHTAHQSTEVRETAIANIVTLYARPELHNIIEEYALFYLGFLRLPQPPIVLFGPERGRPHIADSWTDDAVKACLYLYLALLPLNQHLIQELSRVYVQTVGDVKRTILRLVEQPVRGMGMDSPQLLTLVEQCPKGAETLVTRVIHILTDKAPPSAELVKRVRELYQTRVSDVRFLIPVLNGLTKREVIAALPKLIKLNPIVVKEVFNRLLGTHSESIHSTPITPAELLIALHTIDPMKCELKTIIKATSLCFVEKQAYTQEVLAVVMQNLMEVTPLPTLLMRTVIQSLSLYPRLIGFVMNILQRLILKQVWRQKKVWEGFIKCCQRTRPQSFVVLLQLPPAQLADALNSCPEMRQPLFDHVMTFTDNQRSHIPQSVMDVLLGTAMLSRPDFKIKMEPMSPPDLKIDMKEELLSPNRADEPVRLFAEPAPPGMD